MNSEADLEIREHAQDYAAQTIAGEPGSFPPAPPAGLRPEDEQAFLREYFAVLDDLLVAGATLAGLQVAAATAQNTPRFTIRPGHRLHFAPGQTRGARALPVFRSGTGDIRGAYAGTVLYADIVPLGQSYAIFELRGDESNLRLHIVGGGKNDGEIYISLYTNGRLVEKSLLGKEISWDLSDCAAGRYQLNCNDRSALSFQIQE